MHDRPGKLSEYPALRARCSESTATRPARPAMMSSPGEDMPSPGSALRHAAQPLLNHPTGSRGQETLSKSRQGWCQRETHRSCDLAGTLHVKRTQEASSNTKTAKGLTLALKPPELRRRIEGPDFPFRSTPRSAHLLLILFFRCSLSLHLGCDRRCPRPVFASTETAPVFTLLTL